MHSNWTPVIIPPGCCIYRHYHHRGLQTNYTASSPCRLPQHILKSPRCPLPLQRSQLIINFPDAMSCRTYMCSCPEKRRRRTTVYRRSRDYSAVPCLGIVGRSGSRPLVMQVPSRANRPSPHAIRGMNHQRSWQSCT